MGALIDIPSLIVALDEDDWNKRDEVANSIGQLGIVAVPDLMAAFKDGNEKVRVGVVIALGRIGAAASPAFAMLEEVINEKNISRDLTYQAIVAVGNMGAPNAAVPLLTNLLTSEDSVTRICAVQTLGKLGKAAASAIPHLIHTLNDSEWTIRRATVEALIQMDKLALPAIPTLIGLIRDRNEWVRHLVISELGRMGRDAVLAVPMLIDMVKDMTVDFDTRVSCLTALEHIGIPYVMVAVEDARNKSS